VIKLTSTVTSESCPPLFGSEKHPNPTVSSLQVNWISELNHTYTL